MLVSFGYVSLHEDITVILIGNKKSLNYNVFADFHI